MLWKDPTAAKGVSATGTAVLPLSPGAARALPAALRPWEAHQEPLASSAAEVLIPLSNSTGKQDGMWQKATGIYWGRARRENKAKDKPSHPQYLEVSF